MDAQPGLAWPRPSMTPTIMRRLGRRKYRREKKRAPTLRGDRRTVGEVIKFG